MKMLYQKRPSGRKMWSTGEGVYVGYRYYDSAGKAVRYPFGYGLSYTSFAYTDLEICWPKVSVTVTNTGAYKGAEVVQLYIGPEKGDLKKSVGDTPCNNRLFRPEKELKGYVRLELDPGESKKRSFCWMIGVLPYGTRDGRFRREIMPLWRLLPAGISGFRR